MIDLVLSIPHCRRFISLLVKKVYNSIFFGETNRKGRKGREEKKEKKEVLYRLDI